ncbi:unnamed protein product [Leptidea sinapis]|uniref:Uncharacterized protein n=1 Tax=Leptidea sinapis TaxID=189913 RepID=A0A5E4QRD7_9NEOP|nr:unnamed protein product [Leptidea sinapis]
MSLCHRDMEIANYRCLSTALRCRSPPSHVLAPLFDVRAWSRLLSEHDSPASLYHTEVQPQAWRSRRHAGDRAAGGTSNSISSLTASTSGGTLRRRRGGSGRDESIGRRAA